MGTHQRIAASLLALGILGTAAFLRATAADQEIDTGPAMEAADAWLAHVDAGRYGQSWQDASQGFRDAVTREKWDPNPPNVDLNGFFFSADTVAELAGKIKNPYQRQPMSGSVLEQTVAKYNSYVEMGTDTEFGKPTPMFKIQKPPFYAAWSTPILHDTLTGLKINTKCQVIDTRGQVIPGLYAAGETAGGFALHGLPRVTVFGRIAGREAATAKV